MSDAHTDPVESTVPLMVRTEISRPDRSMPSVRVIDWNNRGAVHNFAKASKRALQLGGSASTRAIGPNELV